MKIAIYIVATYALIRIISFIVHTANILITLHAMRKEMDATFPKDWTVTFDDDAEQRCSDDI